MITGTSGQQRFKTMMDKKQKCFVAKYKTYESHVKTYHMSYPEAPVLRLPTIDGLRTLPLEDSFWDVGHLTHPNEAWAVDIPTQLGINAYRTDRSCKEEKRRIAQEVRQLLRSAFVMEEKFESLQLMANLGIVLFPFHYVHLW